MTVVPTSSATINAVVSNHHKGKQPQGLQLRAAQSCRRFDAVVVDVENVRGRSGFALSHAELLQGMEIWSRQQQQSQPVSSHQETIHVDDGRARRTTTSASGGGRVTLVVDHGSENSAYWLKSSSGDSNCAIVFAGPVGKADDTIANSLVPFLAHDRNLKRIAVVTRDQELIRRCQRAAVSATTIGQLSSSSRRSRLKSNTKKKNILLEEDAEKEEETESGWPRPTQLEILSPDSLLADLEKIAEHAAWLDAQKNETAPAITGRAVMVEDVPSGLVTDYELKLGSDLLEIEALLKRRAGMHNKRRKKLRIKGQQIWQKLQAVSPRTLERIVDVLKQGPRCESLMELSVSERTRFLSKWESLQRSKKRKETTQDRIVLAEAWRLELEEQYGRLQLNCNDDVASYESPAKAYVMQTNGVSTGLRNDETTTGTKVTTTRRVEPRPNVADDTTLLTQIKEPKLGALRLVVVSDTHGMEDQLIPNTNNSCKSASANILPPGDVLLHLGDFAADRSPDEAQRLHAFDLWLARQPHPVKVVLRGNHDPRSYDFSASGATYVTSPRSIVHDGYTIACVPYLSGGLRRKRQCLPSRGADVIASHVPPRRVLDRCSTGAYAGSLSVTQAVAKLPRPPALWVCGHIHEGRGVVRQVARWVGSTNKQQKQGVAASASSASVTTTTVVNAASANPGIARRLDYGPVVIQLGVEGVDQPTTRQKNNVTIVDMDGQYVFLNQRHSAFFKTNNDSMDGQRLLLAVDLGLRTGVSLFNDRGQLLRSAQFQFESMEDLEDGATRLLKEWEIWVEKLPESSKWTSRITHIAIEGEHGNPPLGQAWQRAAAAGTDISIQQRNQQRAILWVQPEEWRTDLLTAYESASGEQAKAASRRLAQQVIVEYGIPCAVDDEATDRTIEESMDMDTFDDGETDRAEAILLGLHVTRRLGWGTLRDPPISN